MLELTSVTKKYITKAGETAALNDINITFGDSGLVFITGKSGSGKTTLLNVIGGLDGIDSGDIAINGKKFSTFTRSEFDSYRNTFIGFIFQEYNLLSEYTVGKNVEIANELQGSKTDKEEVSKLFEMVDIAGMENRKTSQLSGGQRQRVAIARALIKNPQIIMADEPTGALDSSTGKQIIEKLKELSKEKLVIVVSHDMELAEKYGDRIIRLIDGKIVEDVTVKDVEIDGNVHEDEEQITIKSGAKLTKEETEKLVSAIGNSKKVAFTEKPFIRERKNTSSDKICADKHVNGANLINSKMKFTSALMLGLKSVATKPVRLMFTILLSLIAFGIFGIFDAVASYSNAKAIAGILQSGDYQYFSAYASYTDDNYDGYSIKMSQNQIDQLNKETGYKFRGIYELDDSEAMYNEGKRLNYNRTFTIENLPLKSTVAFNYYMNEVIGLMSFSADEIETTWSGSGSNATIETQTIDPNGFNFKLVAGSFPTSSAVGDVVDIAISKYMAESALYWLTRTNEPIKFGGVERRVYKIEDFVGIQFCVNSDDMYRITGIFDCGDVPEKYADIMSVEDESLQEDFLTYMRSGCNLMFFVTDEYITNLRKANNRAVNYVANANTLNYSATYDYIYSMEQYYYSTDDVDSSKIVVFDDVLQDKESRSLTEDQALIHVNNLKVVFANEIKTATQNDLISTEFNRNYNVATNDRFDIEMRRESIKYIMTEINAIRQSMNLGLNSYITVKGTDIIDDEVKFEKQLNVVGVYFGVDTDDEVSEKKLAPIMVSKAGLNYLGVYDNQGIYSRAITPVTSNANGAGVIGDYMNADEGLKLIWFKNGILNVIQSNKELMAEFITLFLYLAIILAVFSIFMLFNYISTSIMNKKQSVGILRALGANGKNIFEMFITESLIISILNGILAAVLAYFGCILVNVYIVDMLNLSISIAQYGFRQVAIIGAGSIFAGILSSLIPIIRIARKKPVELIRKV